jgi:hypothetical protein
VSPSKPPPGAKDGLDLDCCGSFAFSNLGIYCFLCAACSGAPTGKSLSGVRILQGFEREPGTFTRAPFEYKEEHGISRLRGRFS